MLKLILVIVIMCVGFYYKWNYDKKFVMPVVEENEDLVFIKKWALIFVVVAIAAYIMQMPKVALSILFVTIPFVLYLNIRSYWLASKNNKK